MTNFFKNHTSAYKIISVIAFFPILLAIIGWLSLLAHVSGEYLDVFLPLGFFYELIMWGWVFSRLSRRYPKSLNITVGLIILLMVITWLISPQTLDIALLEIIWAYSGITVSWGLGAHFIFYGISYLPLLLHFTVIRMWDTQKSLPKE